MVARRGSAEVVFAVDAPAVVQTVLYDGVYASSSLWDARCAMLRHSFEDL